MFAFFFPVFVVCCVCLETQVLLKPALLNRNPGVITIEDVLENALAEAGAISDANRGDFKKVRRTAQFFHNMVSDTLQSRYQIAWNRCARTDKGVSAIGNIISCRLVQIPNLLEEANKRLPEDIRIMGTLTPRLNFLPTLEYTNMWHPLLIFLCIGIQRVTNNFNSRLRADSRWYEYILPAYVFAPHVVNADVRAYFASQKEESVFVCVCD
jgi:tRNA pseudouridine38-40 synthase